MFTATASATYTASSSGTASASGNSLEEAFNNANIAALEAAKNSICDAPDSEYIEVDNLVIGAGTGGTYLASRLLNFKPHESLLIVDKLSDYGGLLINSKVPGTDTYIELSAIRFFPDIHPRVAYLAKKYDLPLVEYLSEGDVGQSYYLRDKLFTSENVIPDSDSVYNVREDEKGINPEVTLVNNLEKFFDIDKIKDLRYRIELFKNVLYSNQDFQPLAQQNMSEENYIRLQDMVGYNDYLSLKTNFIPTSVEVLSFLNSTTQYRFANGYSSLTKTMASKNSLNTITFNDLNSHTFDEFPYNSLFNTAIVNIEYSTSKKMWKIVIGSVQVNSPEEINYTYSSTKTIYAKTIYSTIQLIYLKYIHKFTNEYFNLCENNFINMPAMRVYLKFETDWMTEKGIGYGRSFTTLNGSQLIHYADKILMFYTFNQTKSSKLFNYLPDNIQIQKEMIEPNESTFLLVNECIKIIKASYGVEELPKVTGIAYASWISPLRYYSGRNLQTLKSESLYDILMSIMFPYGKDGNFYILENGMSFNTTWNEGSLELIDFYFNLIYGEPLFGEVLIK